jgi:TrmH family RNA methyltransferase
MSRTLDMTARNSEYQRFETLKRNREKRARQGLFFLEGVHPVEQAVLAGYEFYAVGIDRDARLSGWAREMLEKANPETVYRMGTELHRDLSDREEPCELLCLARQRPGLPEFAADPLALYAVFDRPSSPGNLGTVFRSADAFGARCVLTTGHAADFYDPQCVRASIGTLFRRPHMNMESAEEAADYLRARPEKPRLVGTSARGDALLTEIDLTCPVALIVGNETFGLSKAWKERCDVLARIPISGAASSLNAGSAATVCYYEVARQRGFRHE